MTTGNSGKWNLDRRQVLAGGAVAALTAGLGSAAQPARAQNGQFAGKQIRVLTWADNTGQAAVRNIMKPFETATGAKVVADLTGLTSEMVAKIKASAARPQYDVVILSGFGAAELAKAGVVAKPDPDKIPNLEHVFPDYRSGAAGFGVGYFLWSDGLLFNTKTFANPPTSYDALWDDKAKGRVFVPPANTLMAMELIIAAAKMAGGSQMSPDAGFELLRRLKPRLLTISGNAGQIAELFRAGSLDAGGVYSPLEMADFIGKPEYDLSGTYDLKEGFFTDLQFMVLPKGRPDTSDVAHAFINFALEPEVQARMAEEVWYGPINRDTKLSEKALKSPYIASPDVIASKATKVDVDHLASVRTDWTRRYSEALAG
jgi:putative spermidine/putrescine transport system substrate-binding protein